MLVEREEFENCRDTVNLERDRRLAAEACHLSLGERADFMWAPGQNQWKLRDLREANWLAEWLLGCARKQQKLFIEDRNAVDVGTRQRPVKQRDIEPSRE